MTFDVNACKEMIARCRRLREEGRNEAVLRSEFSSWLRRVFPRTDDASWVNHYTEGSEAGTEIIRENGVLAQRFIDNLVRATVIEYESDLRKRPLREHGYDQVREYAAGAVRAGTPIHQVRGILSDTVDWFIYDAHLAEGVSPADCRPEDITMREVESLRLTSAEDGDGRRFAEFLKKHLAREQSRSLRAEFITSDLGLNSQVYARAAESLAALVNEGREDDPSIQLATDLWSRFVDHLEGEVDEFRTSAYVDEAYIAILARLLCANVLERRALLSNNHELLAILGGVYFEERFRLHNIVEQDYFAWMTRVPHSETVIRVARGMQADLYAYDFGAVGEEDLFGRLMAQLARRTQRKLLGQEWTPQWVAKELAEKCLSYVPASEPPRLVDMCCGSGAILVEVIKAVRRQRSGISFEELGMSATGFDIDPLAVILAKTSWVVALADEIRQSTQSISVPIYHADSLFAITPVSRKLPQPGEGVEVVAEFDGQRVTIPVELVGPEYGVLFDEIVDWCYDESVQARELGAADGITSERATQLLQSLLKKHDLSAKSQLWEAIGKTILTLARKMAALSIANRNGIWAFILRNTYRPGLLAGQFNGLVSNPPWLAMSQFADNPYKAQLTARARSYGIKPGGAAHLHLELATTYLLHAVDRYLKAGAGVACLVPGTVFKGQHHGKLRARAYLDADRAVAFEVQEVWGIEPGTFKVRAGALVGMKQRRVEDVDRHAPSGAVVSREGVESIPLHVRHLGTRTAWVLGGSGKEVGTGSDVIPYQGADLMPRPAVCVEVLDRQGTEWRVKTPTENDPDYFAVKDAKKLRGKTFAGVSAPQFIHSMLQSLNLLPFMLDRRLAKISIPAHRQDDGRWKVLSAAEIRTAGYNQTARRLQRIDSAMADEGIVKPLGEKIDERNKLSVQVFPRDQYVVVNGAGGGVVCGAFFAVREMPDVVIDQTLYWQLAESEDEAWFRVGFLNSDALTEAIRAFNPEGELGPRHLHTLPNRVIPPFEATNQDHVEIADLAQRLSSLARGIAAEDDKISDPIKPIASRRRRLRGRLKRHDEFAALEEACSSVLSAGD